MEWIIFVLVLIGLFFYIRKARQLYPLFYSRAFEVTYKNYARRYSNLVPGHQRRGELVEKIEDWMSIESQFPRTWAAFWPFCLNKLEEPRRNLGYDKRLIHSPEYLRIRENELKQFREADKRRIAELERQLGVKPWNS